MMMDEKNKKQELETKLAKCRDLARRYTDAVSAKNIRKATDELEQEIRALNE